MSERYEPSAFESKWQQKWAEEDLYKTREEKGRPKFYGMDFFPYPSGAGLSVGHCRNFVPTDVICRMKFMQGYNVLHPMGFDSFGLPAENEAIKNETHPAPMIERYAANYKRQMDLIGISYDWSRSFSSADPRYYKWTQWIFEVLYKKGLAYRASAPVNWCPKDKTALANEEVVGGLCERCGTPVEKRNIPQWYFRITDYAQRLLDDLEELDWPDGIKAQQRNWIGRSEGVQFRLKVAGTGSSGSRYDLDGDPAEQVGGPPSDLSFEVFTTRIDTIFGVTFCVLAPEHTLVEDLIKRVAPDRVQAIRDYQAAARSLSEADRTATSREKTGVFTGAFAINPANGEPVPIWLADYVLATYGTGAIMAVPAHDERDFEFAKAFGLAVLPVIKPLDSDPPAECYPAKDGVMINSGEYNGQSIVEGQLNLARWMESLGIGKRIVQYKLRDWLISRQRYWGCPIPIIHTKDGEDQLVPEDCLPVLLPNVERYQPGDDGSSPLAGIDEFVNVTDLDGRLGRRETDTMGGFACSSWYFLRFCDPHNDSAAWSLEKASEWMPVDCYVGGAEHAVMHLLYARFWTKVLFDAGLVSVKEPFARLENQGQVLGYTPYRKPRADERLGVGEDGILVSFKEADELPKEDLIYRWVRMSKSKGNVVTPDEAKELYGADALRMYLLFVAPFNADVQWSNDGMQGMVRFLNKVFKLTQDLKPLWLDSYRATLPFEEMDDASRKLRRLTHQTIRSSTEDIERFAFNTYVSGLMKYVNGINDLLGTSDSVPFRLAASEALESLILLLAPGAPHSADELWESVLGREGSCYKAEWPSYDENLAAADTVTVAVQVNGKLRDTVELPAGSANAELERAAHESEKVQTHLEGKTIRKVIVIPDKLVNIVAS
jgi:leucyl-tRNA synthetase